MYESYDYDVRKKMANFFILTYPLGSKDAFGNMSDAYLEHSQKFMMKDFCENS